MAANDFKFVKGKGPAQQWQVDDRTTSGAGQTIKFGEPLIISTTAQYVIIPTGEFGKVNSDQLVGLANGESTELSAANGTVNVATFLPGRSVIRGKEETAASADTQAEINALINDAILGQNSTARSSAGTFYFRSSAADNPNLYAFVIVDGDPTNKTLDCMVMAQGCVNSGNLKGQTID